MWWLVLYYVIALALGALISDVPTWLFVCLAICVTIMEVSK